MIRGGVLVLLALVGGSAFAAPPPGGPRAFEPQSHSAGFIGQATPKPPAVNTPTAIAPTKASTPTDPIVARYSGVYEGCMHKAVSTLDMVDCGSKETERWDARLNRAYQARMTSLNDRQRRALKTAEKAWTAFRDADCTAYEDEDWGTISKIDAAQCFLRRTVERTLELEAFPADHGPG